MAIFLKFPITNNVTNHTKFLISYYAILNLRITKLTYSRIGGRQAHNNNGEQNKNEEHNKNEERTSEWFFVLRMNEFSWPKNSIYRMTLQVVFKIFFFYAESLECPSMLIHAYHAY